MFIYGLVDKSYPDIICYIGKTELSLRRRFTQHLSTAKRIEDGRIKLNNKMYNWMNSINRNIDIILIEECSKDILKEREIYYISLYRDKFDLKNTSAGGDSGPSLFLRDNGNSKKVLKYSLEGEFIQMYDTIKEAGIYNNISPGDISTCKNTSRVKSIGGFMWLDYSENYKTKIPAYERKTGINKKIKVVLQYDIKGNLIASYKGRSQAANFVKGNKSNILAAIKGRTITCKGYMWFYKENFSLDLLEQRICRYNKYFKQKMNI